MVATTFIDQTKISTSEAQEDQHGLPLFIFATSSCTGYLNPSNVSIRQNFSGWTEVERFWTFKRLSKPSWWFITSQNRALPSGCNFFCSNTLFQEHCLLRNMRHYRGRCFWRCQSAFHRLVSSISGQCMTRTQTRSLIQATLFAPKHVTLSQKMREDGFSVASQHSADLIDIKWDTSMCPTEQICRLICFRNPNLLE